MGDDTQRSYPPSARLDENDRRLLDAIQQGMPLDECPYYGLAQGLGLAEQDVLDRLERIRSEGLISRISAIFDTRSLGYDSVLVAAKYAPEQVDGAAEIVNQHPGVSHNYLRTAEYNLWYTLAVPPDSRLGLERTAAKLSELSGAVSYRLLPAERVFKIGVRLSLLEDPAETSSAAPVGEPAMPERDAACGERRRTWEITPEIKAAILGLQEDLPIEPQPFHRLARKYHLDVKRMLKLGQEMLAGGIMRRYAAVLRHRKVGFGVNCMTVWSVPAGRVDEVGAALASFGEVTHCYLRPSWPDWPYNLYGMVHCRSDEQCRDLIERMKGVTGITDMLGVFSTKEYKKVRLQYFSPAFAEWEARHAS